MRKLMCAVAAVAAFGAGAFGQADLKRLSGNIKIDGSSTVYPITEAVAEEFKKAAPGVNVTVGISGTGGGFKRFVVGETDISDASRPIKKEENDKTVENKIEYIEVPIAYDGLTIVVNTKNTWVDKLTLDEIKKIFADSADGAKTWKDVRPTWPDRAIKIFAPGTDSGTFDYFKEVVVGDKGAIRGDMSVSEDDNVLVRGVEGSLDSIGFFGCAYYFENKADLKAVPVVNPKGEAVLPSDESVEKGTYAPFSRPLFIYVNKKAAARPEVKAFVEFYLAKGPALVSEVGYVKLPGALYDRVSKNVASGRTGTQFLNDKGEKVHGPLTEVYK